MNPNVHVAIFCPRLRRRLLQHRNLFNPRQGLPQRLGLSLRHLPVLPVHRVRHRLLLLVEGLHVHPLGAVDRRVYLGHPRVRHRRKKIETPNRLDSKWVVSHGFNKCKRMICTKGLATQTSMNPKDEMVLINVGLKYCKYYLHWDAVRDHNCN